MRLFWTSVRDALREYNIQLNRRPDSYSPRYSRALNPLLLLFFGGGGGGEGVSSLGKVKYINAYSRY